MSVMVKVKHFWNKVRYQLSFVLLAFYLTIGCLFMFSDLWINIIPSGRNVIGFGLVTFAVLRFYVSLTRYQSTHRKIRKKSKQALEKLNDAKEN